MDNLNNPVLPICWKILVGYVATIHPEVQLQNHICGGVKDLWKSGFMKQHRGDGSISQSSGERVMQEWWGMYQFLDKDLGHCEKSSKNEPGCSSELSGEHEDHLAVWAADLLWVDVWVLLTKLDSKYCCLENFNF